MDKAFFLLPTSLKGHYRWFLWQSWLLHKNRDRFFSKCMIVFYDILSGTNWKTAMLVLSPLAFILGLIILTLNVHYNK